MTGDSPHEPVAVTGLGVVSPIGVGIESFWEARGWGLGVSVMTSRAEVAGVPGRFGWDGAFGGSWYVDPREDLVGVLMTQVRPGALRLPPVVLDFWTSIYQAIDD